MKSRLSRGAALFFPVFYLFVAGPLPWPAHASAPQPAYSEKIAKPPIDPDAPAEARRQIAPYVFWGNRTEFKYQVERDFDLNDNRADELSFIKPEDSLSIAVRPNAKVESFLNMKLLREVVLKEKRDKKKRRFQLEIAQLYLRVSDVVKGLKSTVGRQRIDDPREWLYDEELDAVRMLYKRGKVQLDAGLALEGVVDKDLISDEDAKRVDDYLFRVQYRPTKKIKVAIYTIYRHEHTIEEERPFFIGFHSSGEPLKRLKYWMDFAQVWGTEKIIDTQRNTQRDNSFRGFGFDLGLSRVFKVFLKPSLFAGYAFGSGDSEPGNGKHEGFRQTGLQDNSDKITGVSSIKYYGELTDPELSNLMIFTAGGGIRPFEKLSMEVLYHYYQQHRKTTRIKDWEIETRPTGTDRRLGHEIDFVIGLRDLKGFDLETVFGMFLPGPAFHAGNDNTAFFAEITTRYNF